MSFYVYYKINDNYYIFATVFWIIQFVSQLFTALMNPGIPSRQNYLPQYIKVNKIDLNKKNPDLKICRLCNIIVHKDKEVSHCEDCDICILGI